MRVGCHFAKEDREISDGTNFVGQGTQSARIQYDCKKEFGEELRGGGTGGLYRQTGDLGKPAYTPVRLDDESRITDEEE